MSITACMAGVWAVTASGVPLEQATTAAHRPPVESVQLLDVPFVAQSELLCGGASVAMVFRYWGERGVDAETFTALVDTDSGGIGTTALVREVRTRGWRALTLDGDPSSVRRHLAAGRPVIALIEVDDSTVYHYVTLTGWESGVVVFHDPAVAPNQTLSEQEFQRRWAKARHWALVIRSAGLDAPSAVRTPQVTMSGRAVSDPCSHLVSQGIDAASARDWDDAETFFHEAMRVCPNRADPWRELAGMRLLQSRPLEAVELAEKAARLDPGDELAWSILATARYLDHDPVGALAAWNELGAPTLDLVRIDGLERLPYALVSGWLELPIGEPLSGEAFGRAQRRVGELPALVSSTLKYRPIKGGLAEVSVGVAERSLAPSRLELVGQSFQALAEREIPVDLPNLFHGGELWSFRWRYWEARPRVALGLSVPGLGPLPGVVRFEAAWQRQDYSLSAPETASRSTLSSQTDRHFTMNVSDWASADVRWQVELGVSEWEDRGGFAMLGGAIEKRAMDDRLVARGSFRGFVAGERPFAQAQIDAGVRSSTHRRGLVSVLRIGLSANSADTPITLWDAGGVGHVPGPLLRAHPLLRDGVLDADRLSRRLVWGGAELQGWFHRIGPMVLGAAAFVDAAKPWKLADDDLDDRASVDVGVGLRVHLSRQGTLRVDVGRGLVDTTTAWSIAWQQSWSAP